MDARPVLDKLSASGGPPQHKPEPQTSAADAPFNSSRGVRTSSRASARTSGGAPDYGHLVWGADYRQSGTLDYVRSHANRMIRRVDAEDERELFVLHKHVQDVRVYKRVSSADRPHPSPARFSPGASFSSSRSSARIRAPSTSVGGSGFGDEDDDWARVPGHFEVRAVTRVRGTLERILSVLAPESGRDAYWLAANTQKNLRFATVTHAERVPSPLADGGPHPVPSPLADEAPFPRWTLQYLLTKFIKHSRTMDVAFSEFAAIDPPSSASPSASPYSSASASSSKPARHPRRGFVYRRSVDVRTLGDPVLQRKLAAVVAVGTDASVAARADERVHRFFLQDWLVDVVEAADEHGDACKIVLTARALFCGGDEQLRRSMRIEFREFVTNYLVAVRKLLETQYMALERGPISSRGTKGPRGVRTEARSCAVCSNGFSLIRKRHTCRSCASVVCNKCCAPKLPSAGAVSSAGLLGGPSTVKGSPLGRECVLCAQFGPNASPADGPRESAAPTSLSVPSAHADEDEDEGADDLAAPALATASFCGPASSRGRASPFASPPTSAPQIHPRPRTKFRTDSSDSTGSARSNPGIVLLSDIDSLSLTGGFRRVPSASSANGVGKAGPPSRTSLRAKRPDRAVSEDNVLAARSSQTHVRTPADEADVDEDGDGDGDEQVYTEDDLANFTLELAP